MQSIQDRLRKIDLSKCNMTPTYKVPLKDALRNDYIVSRLKQYGVPYDVYTTKYNTSREQEYWSLVSTVESYLRNNQEPPKELTDKLQLESIWYNTYLESRGK